MKVTSLRPTRLRELRGAGLTLALALATASHVTWVGATSASAQPVAPTLIYEENFQNVAGATPVLRLNQYTGTTGQTYTADPAWLTGCNGWISSYLQSPTAAAQVADCGNAQGSWNSVQQMAYALGQHTNMPDPAHNYSVSAYTYNQPPRGAVEFQTATNIALATNDRFVTFSVDVGAINCYTVHPILQFYLVEGNGHPVPVGEQIDGCASPKSITVPAIGVGGARSVQVGTYTSNGAVLVTGDSIGVRMVNVNGGGAGNDHAFDSIRILDVSPSMLKSFTPSSLPQGGTATLTFTIENTSELGSKPGWSFTDTLPAGLTVAGTGATTCPTGTVNAPGGSSTIVVTGGLSTGMASCTVAVPVTSSAAGSYTNGTRDVITSGLNPPGDATVNFTPVVDLAITKTASPNPYVPGQALTYTVQVGNAGPSDAVDAAISDSLPAQLAGAGFTWTCTASAGSSCTAGGTGDITDTADIDVGGTLTYTVTGTVPSSLTESLSNTATVTPPSGTTDPGCAPSCSASNANPANPTVALSVAKTSTPDPYLAGRTLTYTITVTNAGPSDAVATTVSDSLPSQLSGAGFTWTCVASAGSTCAASGAGDITDTADILAGGTLTYTATGTAPANLTGQLSNTATVTPPSGTTDTGCTPRCSTTHNNPPNPEVGLAITKAASSTSYEPGQKLTYTVTVTNAGPSNATGATISDPLPAALQGAGFAWTCVASTGSSCTASGKGGITDTVDVAAGGNVTYKVIGTVPDRTATPITNTATVMRPPGTDDAGCDPSCTATATVTRRAAATNPTVKLAITKTSTPHPYAPGQKLTYTVTVTNAGPANAIHAKVSDKLPKALVGKGFTWICRPSTGSTCTAKGSGDIRDTVTIRVNGRVTYTVSGTIPAAATGRLVNTATVTPAAGTTDSGCKPDCTATADVPVTTLPVTGPGSRGHAAGSVALIALGVALFLWTRRRPTTPSGVDSRSAGRPAPATPRAPDRADSPHRT